MLLAENADAKVEDTIAFLRLLRRHLGGKLTICWDRGRIHDHSLAVRQWLAKHKGIQAGRFPPYAPDLNPDEYVWPYAKYAKLCNYAAPSLSELRERIDDELGINKTVFARRDARRLLAISCRFQQGFVR